MAKSDKTADQLKEPSSKPPDPRIVGIVRALARHAAREQIRKERSQSKT